MNSPAIRAFGDRFFPSIGRKVAAAVVFVILVVGGIFVYNAQRTGFGILEQEMDTKSTGVINLLEAVLENVMEEGQHAHLAAALNNTITSPDIRNVEVIRNDGTVAMRAVQHAGRDTLFPLAPFGPLAGVTARRSMMGEADGSILRYILSPIPVKPSCIRCHPGPETVRGYLALTLSMDDVRAKALGHRSSNIAMSILTFGGIGIVLFFAIAVLVIRPIKRLHSHIRKIQLALGSPENLGTKPLPLLPDPVGKDEIADLCLDFNNLLTRLNDANSKLTELYRAQLEHADRLATTGQMAASMAHEIKNPIAGVLGAVQVFESETAPGDPRKEIFAEMKVQLERVNHAVNDLLSYARPTPPMFESIALNDVIRKTVTLLSQQTRSTSVRIETSLPDRPVMITADRKQLQQVIWNIILNAVQSIDGEGTVTIGLGKAGRVITLTITDTGRGIPEHQIGSIFAPFFTTRHKGTGLGMTISRQIIEKHNGSIAVSSRVGTGTTVTITLPAEQPARS